MVAPVAAAVERIRCNAVCTPRQQWRDGATRTGSARSYLRFGRYRSVTVPS